MDHLLQEIDWAFLGSERTLCTSFRTHYISVSIAILSIFYYILGSTRFSISWYLTSIYIAKRVYFILVDCYYLLVDCL